MKLQLNAHNVTPEPDGAGYPWSMFLAGATALALPLLMLLDVPRATQWGLVTTSGVLTSWLAYLLLRTRQQAAAQQQRLAGIERQLLESENRAHATIEHAAVGIALVGLQGQWLQVNDALCRIVGYPRDELLTKTFQDITHPEDLASDLDNVQHLLAGRVPSYSMEKRYLRKDGGIVWIKLTVGLAHTSSGEPDFFVSTVDDIDARKRAEAALLDREFKLGAIVHYSPAALSLKRPDGRYDLANPNLQRIHHLTEQEIVGKTDEQLYPEAVARELRANDALVLSSLSRHVIEEVLPVDGQPRTYLSHLFPVIDGSGQAQFICRISLDITDRKRATEELERHRHHLEELVASRTSALVVARAAAESANLAKSAFLANMSHEIRTPMNAIMGLTHLLARDAVDDQQRARLARVDDAARHLLQVINDILDMSKIEASKMTLESIDFSLDDLLTRAFAMISEPAQAKGLELVLDTDHLPARLRGDPVRLSQALINLLSNAVKFTQQGWIRVRGELLSDAGQRLHVAFEVQDTGTGIAPERQGALFQAFEQADTSATRRHGGTGLGLALTKRLAQMMGGDVSLQSTPGVGSTFRMTAWLDRASDAGESPRAVSLHGLRALLVDDLPEALEALSDRLQMLGLQVVAQTSGADAVQCARTQIAAGQGFDVMLIDWRMAPLDGLATLQQLRHLPGLRGGAEPGACPPAILVSAHDDPALRQQAVEAGFDAVLIKPVTSSALHDTLAGLLRGRAQGPATEPPSAASSETRLREGHAGQRILLAEDNPVNQAVACELLTLAGLVVETADDGAAATALALSHSYDLILMDVQMPVLDGLDATRAIRARAGPAIPIIAMTANAFSEDREACLAAGMNDHVSKPVDPHLLYTTLARWLPALPPTAVPPP